ncbi:MAG TPA: NUDIX domain-containing protein [Solirubrobacteraceae bacterium]|nr:NUDIX domain-containing protein [Solirubrobacteraceae bacterium]
MSPRPAATVLLLRGGETELELLMVQRTPTARFMAGHWVFPGGAVDPSDGPGQSGLRAAARRELEEEASVRLPAEVELVPCARWITPAQSPIRFDTWFYLAAAPPDAAPRVDGVEIVAFRWARPRDALRAATAGELQLAFPTRRQLEWLAGFPAAAGALEHARAHAQTIRPVEPRIVGSGEDARIVLD